MRATAAVLSDAGGEFEMKDIELDDPRADELLVRVEAVGVCHTDLTVRDQWLPPGLPAVLGHEGAGVVEAAGSDTDFDPGDRVVVSFRACHQCLSCRSGKTSNCAQFFPLNFGGRRPDGSATVRDDSGEAVSASFFGQSSFASHMVVSARSAVRLDKDIALSVAAPLACGFQTGAGAVLNTLNPRPGSSMVVFGTGAVGLSALLAAKAVGCDPIIAVNRSPGRLELARDLGATHMLRMHSPEENIAGQIQNFTGGADFAVNTTPSPDVLRQAVESLRSGGACATVGVAAPGSSFSIDMATLMLGRKVCGVMGGDSDPQIFIPQLLSLYREGRFPVDRLVTPYPFSAINDAVRASENGEIAKAVLML